MKETPPPLAPTTTTTVRGPWRRRKSRAALGARSREAERQADEGQGLEDAHATEGVKRAGRRRPTAHPAPIFPVVLKK